MVYKMVHSAIFMIITDKVPALAGIPSSGRHSIERGKGLVKKSNSNLSLSIFREIMPVLFYSFYSKSLQTSEFLGRSRK